MTYTIGTVTVPNVAQDERRKRAELMEMTMPGSDSNYTFVFDFMGVTKEIRLTGSGTGTAAEMKTLRQDLDGLVNGAQSAKLLVSDSNTVYDSIYVYVREVETNLEEGVPYTRLKYQLSLVEAQNV